MTDNLSDVPDEKLNGLGGLDWEQTPELIETDGSVFAVGWDEYGLFNIMPVSVRQNEALKGGWSVRATGTPATSFHRGNIDQLLDAIEAGL